MRKWLVFVLLFGLMVFPSPGGAAGAPKLDSLNVELWSEYDQPSMLVINQFVVSQDTPLPASVTLRFPKDGNLVAVAIENNEVSYTPKISLLPLSREIGKPLRSTWNHTSRIA